MQVIADGRQGGNAICRQPAAGGNVGKRAAGEGELVHSDGSRIIASDCHIDGAVIGNSKRRKVGCDIVRKKPEVPAGALGTQGIGTRRVDGIDGNRVAGIPNPGYVNGRSFNPGGRVHRAVRRINGNCIPPG